MVAILYMHIIEIMEMLTSVISCEHSCANIPAVVSSAPAEMDISCRDEHISTRYLVITGY